jgi:hypothetical protein
MGLNVTNPPSNTFIPYQQKSIYALASTGGWTAGDYVYVGPGASGNGFFRPTNTSFPISTMVNQGVPVIGSSQTSATRAGCYGPSLLYTTYTGTTQVPDVAAGTESTIYTGTGYYGFTAFTLNNGSYVLCSTGVYPYSGYGILFNSSNVSLGQFALDYTPSYYYLMGGSVGAGIASGGFIIPSFNDSQQLTIKVFNSSGGNTQNITAASGYNPSGGATCIGFSNGSFGIFWSYGGSGYGTIYNSSGTQIYTTQISGIGASYGVAATSIGTKCIVVYLNASGASTKTYVFDAVAASYSEGPNLGMAYSSNTSFSIRATTLTNGNALFVGRNGTGTSMTYSIISPQLAVTTGSLSVTANVFSADQLGGLTYLSGGGFSVAWLDSANSRFKYLRYSDSGGLLSSTATNLSTTLSSSSNANGAITALTSGEIIGAYQGTSSYSYYTQRFSTGSLVQNVSLLSGTTFSPNTGYTLMGIAATTTTAGNYGEVVVGGAATLSASYPSLVSQVSFDYAGTATAGSQANAGSVLARNVSLQGF